jgi:hypothetical protein
VKCDENGARPKEEAKKTLNTNTYFITDEQFIHDIKLNSYHQGSGNSILIVVAETVMDKLVVF